MESLVSLEGYAPELRGYLLHHKYPAIMEALLTGLAMMEPPDPWEFVREKLGMLNDGRGGGEGGGGEGGGREGGGGGVIQWDMFVEVSLRPKLSHMKRGMLETLLDETDQPTQDMFEKAYHFRKMRLQDTYFCAWQVFYEQEKIENEAFRVRLKQAKRYHNLKTERAVFGSWRIYASHKNQCRQAAVIKLDSIANGYMLHLLFHAWLSDYKESRRARRWFNREAGPEGKDGGTEEEWYWSEGEDPISLLAREISVKIFMLMAIQTLCRCARVCRSWKDITEDPILWNKIDFFPIGHFLRDDVIIRICHKYRPLLCHINLRGCTELSSEALKSISHCQNLQDLNLSESKGINETVIHQIGQGCAGLLYLNLSYCYVTDSIIRLLTKHYSSLHYLSLSNSPHFTSKGLLSITSGKGCRRLVYLDLSGCTQLTADGVGFIARGCSILNTLLLDNIPEFDDSMILKLVAHCKTLRYISFLGGSKISDRGCKYLAVENRKLRTIKIECNTVLTDATLRAIGRYCKDLNHLYIAGCSRVTDQGLKGLANLKKLHVLNIADCVRVSDNGVRHVVENAPGAVLRELNLTNVYKISDVTPLRISQHCKSLSCLSFCYCEHISDTGVELLGHIPSLSSLDLSGSSIQDAGIKGLRNNPQFRHLMLAELMDISDDGLQRMCSNLPNLNTLDLSDCELVSDDGLEQITFNCRVLSTLFVSNCHKVTDAGTKCIAKGCPYISKLDMSGCSITDRSISLLRKYSTNLRRLDILCCVDISREAVLKLKRVEVNFNTDHPKFLQEPNTTELPNMPLQPLVDRI